MDPYTVWSYKPISYAPISKSAITPKPLMPCVYGGGEQCAKHGGDGASAHKMGYIHKFPHVSEIGGRPEGAPKSKFTSKKQKYNAGELDPMSSTQLAASPAQEQKPQAPEKALETKESSLGTPIVTDLSSLKQLAPKNGFVYGQTLSTPQGTFKFAGTAVGGQSVGIDPIGKVHPINTMNATPVGPADHPDVAPWADLSPDAIVEAPKEMVAAMEEALSQQPHPGSSNGDYFKQFNKQGYHAFVVGGMVRDFVSSGAKSKDVDLVSNAPFKVISHIAHSSHYVINDAPFVALCQVGSSKDTALDMTSLRSMDQWGEYGPGGSGVGGGQKVAGSIKKDCASRDFACNALFYDPVNKTVIDPTGRGIDDAKNKMLSPSFVDDADKKTWLGNNRLGIRLVKMLMKGYKMSDSLKQVFTPDQMTASLKSFFDSKGSLQSIAAWTVRQICGDITHEASWGDLSSSARKKSVQRLKEFRGVMKDNGFGDAYKKYMGPALVHYTGSSELAG